MAVASRAGDPLKFGSRSIFHLLRLAVSMLPKEIAEPDRQAIDENRIGLARRTVHRVGQCQRFFNRSPGRGPIGAVLFDARGHLRVISSLGRGDIADARGWRSQPLGQTGFSASSAAKNQC